MRKSLRKHWIALVLIVPIVAVAATTLILEEQEKTALKETIRTYFSEESTAEARQAAWQTLVGVGALDFQVLLWGLEQTNAIYMMEPADFATLLSEIKAAGKGQDALLQSCRAALLTDMSAGKACAMDVLVQHADPWCIPGIRAALMNTDEKAFVRTRAVLSLGELKAPDAASDLQVVLTNEKEPLALREACLASLWHLAPESAAQDTERILKDAAAPHELFRRAASCASEHRQTPLLTGALSAATEGRRKAECVRELLKVGDGAAMIAVQDLAKAETDTAVVQAILEGVAATGTAGFEDLIAKSLASESKPVRLSAIKAALRVQGTPAIEDAVGKVVNTGSTEELSLFDVVGQ